MARTRPKPGPLIQAKVSLPTSRAPILHRPRLYRLLEQGLARRLVVVAADAGFGKTTLLTGYLQTHPRKALWYRLDRNDSDPATFLGHLMAAQPLGALRLPRVDVGLVASWDAAARLLVHALERVRGDLLLVLDDYHALRHTSDLRDGMESLISHLPPSVHIAILARHDPDLPLARWRLAGEILELNAEDLRLTPSEMRQLLTDLHGLALSDSTLHLLAARTEGWAAGVMLALHTLTTRGPQAAARAIAELSGTSREIYEYLAQEAFDRHPEAVQRFLRVTSILSRFSAPIADRLLHTRNAWSTIRDLEASHLFVVPLDARRTWFRYHQLFQEFLQRRLEEDEPEAIPDLHSRAGQIWEACGDALEALHHYSVSQQAEEVARVLDAEGETLWVRGQFERLWSLIEPLPPALLERWPRVSMLKGLLLRHRGRMEDAVTCLETARSGLEGMGKAQATDYLGQTYAWMADRDRLLALAREIGPLERFPPAARARLMDLLGRAKEVEGALAEAVQIHTQGMALAREAGDRWGEIRNARDCAVILGQMGEFDRALAMQREGLWLARDRGWTHEAGHLATDLARTLLELGRWSDAHSALAEAEENSRTAPCRRLLGEIHHLEGETALHRGDAAGARACFEAMIRSEHEELARVRLAGLIGLSRALRVDARGEARSLAARAVTLGARISPYHQGVALLNLGTLEGNPDHVRDAAALFRRCGARPYLALACLHLASMHRGQDVDAARRLVREAIERVGTGAQAEFLLAHEALPLVQRFVRDPVIGGGVRKLLDGFPPALQPLYVRMLGPFEVSRGAAEVTAGAFGRRATRQLFKYLLIHRRHPVTREQVIDALWPKSEPRSAANLLKSRLSLLRRALQPHLGEGQPSAFLVAREGTLQLDPRSPCWIDADEFERLADRRDLDSLAEAMDLYRGDLLEEDRYEEWTLAERERLRATFLRALASLASCHEEAGRVEAAVAAWQRLVEQDPCAEQAYQGLIRCALALGRQADALRAFEQCRSRLREDLGVDPAPQTRALLGRLTSR